DLDSRHVPLVVRGGRVKDRHRRSGSLVGRQRLAPERVTRARKELVEQRLAGGHRPVRRPVPVVAHRQDARSLPGKREGDMRPPVTEVKRWPPEVGPSVASRATTRVLGWVVENDFDEIRFDGEFCCVTDLVTLVIAARLLGPAGCMARMAVARPPAIAAYQR